MKHLKPNLNNMWLKLALFSALFSIAAPQQSPYREVGVHDSSFNEGFKSFSSQRQMADFSWNLTSREGFPIIGFDDSTENSEVQFMYDYTGILTGSKNITVLLYQYDCVTPADDSLVIYADYSTLGEISVDLDIIQETIATSVAYNETDDGTAATIEFCLRADYKFESDSLNFYETVVSINVDLTANFTLEAITVERGGSDEASSTLDCDVEIYYCYPNHTEVIPAPTFRQGSALEVCIQVVEEDTSCCIKDIAEMDVDQDQDGDGDWDAHTDPITARITDPLSSKLCSDDVCFVKTQLPSKFFSVRNPRNLTLSGIALLKLCDAGLGSTPDSGSAPSPALTLTPTSQPTDGGIRALATATITVTATATDPITLTNITTTRTITQVTRAAADITTKTTSTTIATTTSAVGSEPEETSNTSADVEELPGYGALVPVAVATATAIEGPTPFVATATATATATASLINSATATGTAISIVGPAATATSTATTTATRTTTEAISLATATDMTPLGTLPTATDTQTGTDTVTAESLATTTATSTATSTFTEA
jgi:hypothetical protein